MDLDKLDERINTKLSDGISNPITYYGEDLTGISIDDPKVTGSPCKFLRWLKDNSNYKYQTFVYLTDTEGTQGINIYNKSDNSLYKKIEVPMGGGESSAPKNQIYINNRKIISETIKVINNSLGFDSLQSRLEELISEGRSNLIGYGGGDLTGVPLAEAGLMRSPCRALRWMTDNSQYRYETFVTLSDTEGSQGINIYNKDDGALHRTISVAMGGGANSDPKNLIYSNNKAIIMEAVLAVQESLEEE